MHSEPETANAIHSRCKGASESGNFGGKQIGLLGTHAFGSAPGKSEHKRRDTGFCDNLLQDLPHGDGAVEDRCVTANDFDINVSDGHEITDAAITAVPHCPGPLIGKDSALLRGGPVSVFAGNSEANVAAAFPVNADGMINFHKDIGKEGKPAKEGDAVRVSAFGVKGGKEDEVLSGEHGTPAQPIGSADRELQRMVALFDDDILHIPAKEGSDFKTLRGRNDFPHSASAGKEGIKVTVEERVDTELTSANGDRTQELSQSVLSQRAFTADGEAPCEPDELIDRGVDDRDGLPDSAIKPNIAAAQRSKVTEQTEGMSLSLSDLNVRGWNGFRPAGAEFKKWKQTKNLLYKQE